MAKRNNLFTTLRKSAARAVPGATHRGTKRGGRTEGRARTVVTDLAKAGGTIRTRVLDRGTTRSNAAKKAAATRRRNATNRSKAAKRGAATRKARTAR